MLTSECLCHLTLTSLWGLSLSCVHSEIMGSHLGPWFKCKSNRREIKSISDVIFKSWKTWWKKYPIVSKTISLAVLHSFVHCAMVKFFQKKEHEWEKDHFGLQFKAEGNHCVRELPAARVWGGLSHGIYNQKDQWMLSMQTMLSLSALSLLLSRPVP